MSKKLFVILAAALCATGAMANDAYHFEHAHGCPPGLAMRHDGCVPPGHAARMGYDHRDWHRHYREVADYRNPYWREHHMRFEERRHELRAEHRRDEHMVRQERHHEHEVAVNR
jgi:hypothetical protein